jgi:hypothetical protein
MALACHGIGGGGASTQSAPDSVKNGDTAVVRLELAVIGAGAKINGRYTDIVGFYRLVGQSDYNKIVPRLVSQETSREVYEFSIPTRPDMIGAEIEYYFELKLDTIPSRLEGAKKIRIV